MFKEKPIRVYVVLIFLFALVILIRSVFLTISSFAPDFSVMWNGARSLLMNRNPYIEPGLFTGIGYPPNSLLFYIPFVLLPYNIAQSIFVSLSALTIFGIVLFSFKSISTRNSSLVGLPLAFSLVVFSFPTRFTLGMGQNNLIVFLLLIISYYFYRTKRKIGTAILLGLAISFKTVFVFFLLFFLFKKEWKILMVSITTIIFVVLLTMIFFGNGFYVFYIRQVIPPLLNFLGREIYYNQGFSGFIARLTTNLGLRVFLTLSLSVITVLSVLVVSLKRGVSTPLVFSLFVVALVLVDSLSWQHHFVWLTFPFIVVTSHALKRKLHWALGLIFVSYLLISWNFRSPSLYSEFPLNLLLSNTFYGGFLLFLTNYIFLLKTHK